MGLMNALAGALRAWDVYSQSDQILAQSTAADVMLEDFLRLQEMRNNLAAYNGVFVDPLLNDPQEHTDTVRVNLVRPIIDTGVSFLFREPPKIEIPRKDGETSGEVTGEDNVAFPTDTPEETWLKECLEENNWAVFLIKEAKNGGITGTPYVKFVPPDEKNGHDYPHLQVLDPACMTIQWDPRDIDHITGYIWQYNTWKKDEKGKTIPIVVRQSSLEQEDRTWVIIDEWAEKSSSYGSDANLDWHEDGRTDWNYTWSPVLHCQNLTTSNEVYGDPDIDATVIEANNAYNFVKSNAQRIYKHHAHPKVYLQGNRGAAAELLKLGPKAIWDIPDPQAKVGQLVPGIDGVQAILLADELFEDMQIRTQTPAAALGVLPQGRDIDQSGVSLAFKMLPLTDKTGEKRKTYGGWIIEICRRLFDMGSFGDKIRVKLIWPNMLPIDKISERQVALMDTQLQIPFETVQENLGYNYEATHPQYLAEQAEAQKLALANAMAQAGPNGQPPAAQMTPAGSQVKGPAASKNDTGPSLQKQQSPGMKGTPANNSR